MTGFHVAVIAVGKVEGAEVEAALARVARAVRAPLEFRGSLPVPQGIEDSVRGQFRASTLLGRLRSMVPQLSPGKLVGAEDGAEKPPLKTDAYVFVTDVDLFTANTDGVFAALVSSKKLAVVSVRRMREAFYRRKANPVKQRSRLVKEIVRMVARLRGVAECVQPQCVMASSKMFADLDLKDEKLCRGCSQRMFEGKFEI